MNENEFKNPSALYRPAPFWSWNDRLNKDELKRQIREMADKGWGSFFMHSRVGLVTGYLSDEWMDMVRTCAEEARKTGTYAWLYDEDKWPSGFAGGVVPEMDETYRDRALVMIQPDQQTEYDTPLCRFMQDGQEALIVKRVSASGDNWFNGACYVDLMNPDAVKVFLNVTHERYKEACGDYFGKEIPGIFTDEPCYFMWNHYHAPALPWSEYLSPYFREKKGYALEDHLSELFVEMGDYRKVRFDFYDCATRLFLESFTKPYYNWCEQNHLKMVGHFMAEDTLTSQTQWIGAAMPQYEFMHWPGIDKLGRNLKQTVTVKQVTSVADQLGKERAMCEVFGCVGQQVSFYHRKWIADWQAALGIGFVNHHLSLYSMRGQRKRDYPANLFYQQPWWDEEKPYSDYTGRLSAAVCEGKRQVDILVIHPISSGWCEYSPVAKSATPFDQPFEQLSNQLSAHKLDYHYGDEMIMEEHATVKDGKLFVGQHGYSTVVVPPCCTLRSSTVRLLAEFVRTAGSESLLVMLPFADRIDGEKQDAPLFTQSSKAGSIGEIIRLLDARYADRVTVTDNATGRNADKVLAHIRETKAGQLIFLANGDEKREFEATVRIPGASSLQVLDLMSGERYDAPVQYENGVAMIHLTFYPAGSLLLLNHATNCAGVPAPLFLDSGVAFNKAMTLTESILGWKPEVLDENVLLLDNASFWLDGEKVLNDEPVSKAWYSHFYKAENGTPFRAEYTFDAMEKIGGSAFAVVEMAENLDRIIFNGQEVKPLKARGEAGAFDPSKSWRDPNFTRIPLHNLIQKGKNMLVLEGKKVNNITGPGSHSRVKDFQHHLPTELEAAYIVGDFRVVDFGRESFALEKSRALCSLCDLTASGYPFYAGRVRYTAEISTSAVSTPVWLRLNQVKAACVGLTVNGVTLPVKYWEPYIFDLTGILQSGTNTLEITAASTLFNVMGPGTLAGILDSEYIGPHTFVATANYTPHYELTPLGIGGVVLASTTKKFIEN